MDIGETLAPDTRAEKFESFKRINSIRETDGSFDLCNSGKRLGTSRLHELHESMLQFISRIEFIRSKFSNLSAHVSGIRLPRPRSNPYRIPRLTPTGRPALLSAAVG